MNYSQKYALIAFLKPMEVGTEFNMAEWPLHITLADVFAIEIETGIQKELANLLAGQQPLVLTVGEEATLGTTSVALIKKDARLQDVHDKIIDLLELYGVEFNTPEFTRKGYLPHSTIQKSGRLNAGEEIEITSISLIDMFPDCNWQQRKILNNFSLKHI